MKVDKFGHCNMQDFKKHKNEYDSEIVSVGCTLKYDDDGNLDARGKLIKNLQAPTESNDCATKDYVDKSSENNYKSFVSINQQVQLLNERVLQLEKATETKKPKTRK